MAVWLSAYFSHMHTVRKLMLILAENSKKSNMFCKFFENSSFNPIIHQKGGDTRETDFFHASGTHARFACVNPLGESYEDRIQAIAHLTKGPMRVIF